MTPLKLHLGCGALKRAGWHNVDCQARVQPDEVVDLTRFPWPWADHSAAEISSHHVFEHLPDIVKTMMECRRVLKPGGLLDCVVPYGPSFAYLSDPTHQTSWTDVTVSYFLNGHASRIYSEEGFDLVECKLLSNGPYGTPPGAWRPRLRNLIPFRRHLRFFLLGMYDEVHFKLRKP